MLIPSTRRTTGTNFYPRILVKRHLFKTGQSSSEAKDWLPTVIGSKVSIGSNATILPVKICDNAVIGAGSVVVKDILFPGVYAGNPARLLRKL